MLRISLNADLVRKNEFQMVNYAWLILEEWKKQLWLDIYLLIEACLDLCLECSLRQPSNKEIFDYSVWMCLDPRSVLHI